MLINTVQKSNVSKEILSCGKLLKACDFMVSDLSTNDILKEIFSSIYKTDNGMDSEKIKEKKIENNRNSFNFDLFDVGKDLKYYLS